MLARVASWARSAAQYLSGVFGTAVASTGAGEDGDASDDESAAVDEEGKGWTSFPSVVIDSRGEKHRLTLHHNTHPVGVSASVRRAVKTLVAGHVQYPHDARDFVDRMHRYTLMAGVYALNRDRVMVAVALIQPPTFTGQPSVVSLVAATDFLFMVPVLRYLGHTQPSLACDLPGSPRGHASYANDALLRARMQPILLLAGFRLLPHRRTVDDYDPENAVFRLGDSTITIVMPMRI